MNLRRTGIDIIGDVPWGTHFCNFYSSKQDLLDILVPYFKAGLEDNEFCMWVTAEPLERDEAIKAMRKTVDDFDRRFEAGQIEILPYDDWYVRDGGFDSDRVLNGWVEKLNGALARGYEGLRLTGNTFWLEKKDWDSFLAYEDQVNNVIGKYRMLAVCTYSLRKCDASEVIDVVNTHQFALAKRDGKWDRLERAEYAAAEAQRRSLARFPDENPNPVLRATIAGELLYANGPATALLAEMGWKEGSPLPPPLQKPLKEAAEQNANREFELVAPSKRVYSLVLALIAEEGYANLYGRDVTERRRAERNLRASLERYRSFLEVTGQLGWTTDANGEVVEDMPAWRKFTGQSFEEIKGCGWSKAVHPDDVERTARVWKEAVSKRVPYETEYRLRRHDGVYRHFLARGIPVLDGLDKVSEWVGTCIDITERKQTEEDLRKSAQRLSRSQEIAHLGSWELNLASNELTWSDEVYRIFGLKPQEFGATYEAFLDHVHPEDRAAVDAAYSNSIRDGKDAYEIEHRVVREDTGEVRWVHEKCQHWRDGAGKIAGSVGMVHDITERKHAEQERQRLLELLESKNKELQSIVYVASHDLRSPLVNVSGFTGQLSEECENLMNLIEASPDIEQLRKKAGGILERDIPEYLKFIKTGAQKMQMVINGLLTISRLGNAAINIVELDMNRMISQIVASMTFEIQSRDAEVEVGKLPGCMGDATQINRLFSNLLNNAIKYLDADRKGHIRITGRVEDGMSVYSVSDNGIGIAANHKEKIFEIFHRLNPNDGIGGDGLGLSIVMRILDRHNGRVWVDSELGKGSTFHIALPTA